MGQRSQIYIRFNDENMENKKGLIALYYQWNYGERMISRARQVIEEILSTLDSDSMVGYHLDKNSIGEFKRRLRMACTVNHDMRSSDLTNSDIFGEMFENQDCDCLFRQDNNNGCLFVDIITDKNKTDGKPAIVKYVFSDGYYGENATLMSIQQYALWEEVLSNKNLDEERLNTVKENIKFVNAMATLMTYEEYVEFISTEYSIENAFDYKNLLFQYECAKRIVNGLLQPVKTFNELQTLLNGADRKVLYRLADELKVQYA